MKTIFSILASIMLMTSVYCQLDQSGALTSKNLVFVSGQYPIDATTGQMTYGPIGDLTTVTIQNIEHILKIKGAQLNQVIKTTVYLADIRDYDAMNAAYTQMFTSDTPPTREVIEASNMPLRARIQISCIADKERKN